MLTAEGVALMRRKRKPEAEGVFIAGNWYPSIDHVVPVSKGGRHNWDNVKLAHRLCNSIKKDKL